MHFLYPLMYSIIRLTCGIYSKHPTPTLYPSASTCRTTISPSNGTFSKCPLYETKSTTVAAKNRIRTYSSTLRCAGKPFSTQSTSLFRASAFRSCRCSSSICPAIRARRSHFVSAFCCRWLCSFCCWSKLFRPPRWRCRCWASTCCSQWCWSRCPSSWR